MAATIDYRAYARAAALRNGLDQDRFERQIHNESHFNPKASNPSGARGIAQFMPATAHEWGVNRNDPLSSLDGAARYMAHLKQQFGGDETLAAAAYNAGPGNVRKYNGVPPFPETQAYVANIQGGTGGPPVDPTATAAPDATGVRPDFLGMQNKAIDEHYAALQTELSKMPPIDYEKMFKPAVAAVQAEPISKPLGSGSVFAAALGSPQMAKQFVEARAQQIMSEQGHKRAGLANLREALLNAKLHDAVKQQDADTALKHAHALAKLQAETAEFTARRELHDYGKKNDIVTGGWINRDDNKAANAERGYRLKSQLAGELFQLKQDALVQRWHLTDEKKIRLEQFAKAQMGPVNASFVASGDYDEAEKASAVAQLRIDQFAEQLGYGQTPLPAKSSSPGASPFNPTPADSAASGQSIWDILAARKAATPQPQPR